MGLHRARYLRPSLSTGLDVTRRVAARPIAAYDVTSHVHTHPTPRRMSAGGFKLDTVAETVEVVRQTPALGGGRRVAIVAFVHLGQDDAEAVIAAHRAAGGDAFTGVRMILNYSETVRAWSCCGVTGPRGWWARAVPRSPRRPTHCKSAWLCSRVLTPSSPRPTHASIAGPVGVLATGGPRRLPHRRRADV